MSDKKTESNEEVLTANEAVNTKNAPKKNTQKKSKKSSIEQEVQEMKNLAQRVQADFENYKKRVSKEREEIQQRSTESLLNDLLPVVDSIEQAMSVVSGETEETPISKGVKMVQAQLLETLNKYGVQEISLTEKFNPDFHEAVMSEGDGTLEEPIISDTLRKGYTVHGRVLRPAMVKVQN